MSQLTPEEARALYAREKATRGIPTAPVQKKKPCSNGDREAYVREWRRLNKERLAAYNREWNQRNRERRAVQFAAHYERRMGDTFRCGHPRTAANSYFYKRGRTCLTCRVGRRPTR